MSQQRTGRTTRMLERAYQYAFGGEKVIVIVANAEQVDWMIAKFVRMYPIAFRVNSRTLRVPTPIRPNPVVAGGGNISFHTRASFDLTRRG